MQIKDWREGADNIDDAVAQVNRTDEGWERWYGELRIVEKIIIITGANIPDNQPRERGGVTIMTPQDLKDLLRWMALAIAAKRDE